MIASNEFKYIASLSTSPFPSKSLFACSRYTHLAYKMVMYLQVSNVDSVVPRHKKFSMRSGTDRSFCRCPRTSSPVAMCESDLAATMLWWLQLYGRSISRPLKRTRYPAIQRNESKIISRMKVSKAFLGAIILRFDYSRVYYNREVVVSGMLSKGLLNISR